MNKQINFTKEPETPEEYEELELQIYQALEDFFKDEPTKAALWLRLPNPNFGFSTPLQLFYSGRAEKVVQFINNALYENEPPEDS